MDKKTEILFKKSEVRRLVENFIALHPDFKVVSDLGENLVSAKWKSRDQCCFMIWIDIKEVRAIQKGEEIDKFGKKIANFFNYKYKAHENY